MRSVKAEFYAPPGLTEDRFVSDGRKLLRLSLFSETWHKVEQFQMGLSFLVSGFDKDKKAHITDSIRTIAKPESARSGHRRKALNITFF